MRVVLNVDGKGTIATALSSLDVSIFYFYFYLLNSADICSIRGEEI